MPTMQEVRQKYPQYDDMSDEQLAGALHKKYYSDMPYDAFAAKIGLQAEQAPVEAAKPKREPYTGMILPWATDEEGNNSLAVPRLITGLIDSAKDAYSAPYRAYTGDLRMTDDSGNTSDEAIAEGFNMATWASPTSIASGTSKQVARDFSAMNPRAPSEGAQVAQAARNLDVTLPRAVVSDNAAVNQLGKTVSNIPVVGQPLRKASREAIEQMDDAAKRIQDDLGTGSKEVAGNRIQQDMVDFAKVSEPAKVTELYQQVDGLVKPDSRVPLSETARIAQNITARRNAAKLEGSNAVDFVSRALQSKEGMSYEEIKNLRTAIGELKKNRSELAARKISDSEIDAIYSGLSSDLKTAVKTGGGPDALKAFEEANMRAKTFARDKEALNKVLGAGSSENVSARLIALAGNTSRANIKDLLLAKSKVSKETWDELSSAALQDMGRDAAGNLTPDRFVTSWGKLSDSGKKVLFSADHRKSLDDLATVSSRFKKLNEYANPSGTGQTLMTGALGGAVFVDPITALKVAIPGYVTARILARPSSTKALADYAKAYELAAKAPGQQSQTALATKAKALALIAANGNEAGASNLAARLATVQQTAADEQDNEQIRGPETNPEANRVTDEFNRAYLEGRAF